MTPGSTSGTSSYDYYHRAPKRPKAALDKTWLALRRQQDLATMQSSTDQFITDGLKNSLAIAQDNLIKYGGTVAPSMSTGTGGLSTTRQYAGQDWTVDTTTFADIGTSNSSVMYYTVNTTAATTVNIPVVTQTPSIVLHTPEVARPPRGFNKYVNASDLLEEFIQFAGTEGVRQREFMDLPISLFVKWLIIRAMEEDGEKPDIILELPAPKGQPRCLGCGRFMASDVLTLHDNRCATFYYERTELQAA